MLGRPCRRCGDSDDHCRPVRAFAVSADCGSLRLRHARDRNVAQALVKLVHYAGWIGGGIWIFVACCAAGTSQDNAAPHSGSVRAVLHRPDHCGHVCHCDSLLWISPTPLGGSRRTLRSAPGGNARFDGFGGEQPLRFFLSWAGNPECVTLRAVRLPAYSPSPCRGRNQVSDSGGIVFRFPAFWDGPHLRATRHNGIAASGSVVGWRTEKSAGAGWFNIHHHRYWLQARGCPIPPLDTGCL